jgi:mannosylglycerate hydrolase
MTEQLEILVIPHTHWDREWYQTFQQFRIRLVKTIDVLLTLLERDKHFSHFMLDGQTIVLDDYLEVRPEQEERLKEYIRAGRLLVGPWYLQPDEFLVSGEALIRNLQIGLRRAAELGGVMRVGYVPDCFGHIAQLPQILQGVGIDNAVFWRGVGSEARQSEFYWTAPDGSRVLVIHLADPIGYSNARQMPLHPEQFATRVELLASNILAKATTSTLLFMNGSDHLEPQEGLPAVIQQANRLLVQLDPEREELLARASANSRSNHNKRYKSIHLQIGTLPQYIERVRQQQAPLETLEGEMRSSRYAHLLPSVLSSRIWLKQQNTATEHLMERCVEPLSAWAALLGAPYPQGLISLAWKYLLQNHPHDSICGCSIDQVHRENSVRFSQSQQIGESLTGQAAHYIVGQVCTEAPFATSRPEQEPIPIIVFNPAPGPRTERVQATVELPGPLQNARIVDERGEVMPYRVVKRWRQEIGSMPVMREILANAVAISGIHTPDQLIKMAHGMVMTALGQTPDQEETHVISRISIEDYASPQGHVVHHPLQSGVVAIEVMIAPKGRTTINEQRLTHAGQQVLALLERNDVHMLEITLIDQAREILEFLAVDLPAYGFKTFWFYPQGLPGQGEHEQRVFPLLVEQHALENEFYRVEINPQNGTLTVNDKQSGAIFTGLHRFVDGGDVGDLYTYCPPEQDMLISELEQAPAIEILNRGPVCATLRVSGWLMLPTACSSSRKERSPHTTACSVVSEITLTPGVRRIDIHTRIENRAKDHRLRVFFPVSYMVEDVIAEGTFEVRKRPVVLPHPDDIAEWVEEPVNVFPQKRFIDLSNGETGLSILNRGLPEYEVVREGPGVGEGRSAAALTLLRCVEWLSRGDLTTRRGHAGPMEHTPEAQCPGFYEFDYALIPHKGDWEAEAALVLQEAQAFNTPVTTQAIVTTLHEGKLPSRATLVEVTPATVVVSAIKRGNDGRGMVIRIYNPLSHGVEAQIRPGFSFTHAWAANLVEERQEALAFSGDQGVNVHLRAGGIMTVILE